MNLQTIDKPKTIELGDITIDVTYKDIKNIHLRVYPPTGSVRISAPQYMNPDRIRLFAIDKLSWIERQQQKLRNQDREAPLEYIDRESHYLWGQRYLLTVIETDGPPHLDIQPHKLLLHVRPGSTSATRRAAIDRAYRQQLKQAIPSLIAKWEPLMGVRVAGFAVRKMKTKWGSCSTHSRTIRLNLELTKKPAQCLEYVLVHEMVHLLEPTHNRRFTALMTHFMPNWQLYQAELNRLPVSYDSINNFDIVGPAE